MTVISSFRLNYFHSFAVWGLLLTGIGFAQLLTWELVGWISFRLISHWLSRSATSKQGLLAINANRFGDVALLCWLSLGICSSTFSTSFIFLDFLFLTCMIAKSVVALSYLWLPEAMEGPTPVSALLHSCTLVMAGLFTLFRAKAHHSLPLLPIALLSLVCLATSAYEADVKRIVAYSTVSLVSFLWLLICLLSEHSFVSIALLHAAYKSALFVTLGRLISHTDHASLSIWDSRSVISICWLLVLIAFAPVGSSYVAFKHAALSLDISGSAITGLASFVGVVAAIVAWLAQLRLYPAAFGVHKHRIFLPAVHDWFAFLLFLACVLLIWELALSNLYGLDLSGNLSFVVIILLVSRLPFYISDKLTGKLVVSPIDFAHSVFGFVYLPLAYINSCFNISTLRLKISTSCLALSLICLSQLVMLGT